MTIKLNEEFFNFTNDLKKIYDELKILKSDAEAYMEAYKVKKAALNDTANELIAKWEETSKQNATS
jgi:hypothetical protein